MTALFLLSGSFRDSYRFYAELGRLGTRERPGEQGYGHVAQQDGAQAGKAGYGQKIAL